MTEFLSSSPLHSSVTRKKLPAPDSSLERSKSDLWTPDLIRVWTPDSIKLLVPGSKEILTPDSVKLWTPDSIKLLTPAPVYVPETAFTQVGRSSSTLDKPEQKPSSPADVDVELKIFADSMEWPDRSKGWAADPLPPLPDAPDQKVESGLDVAEPARDWTPDPIDASRNAQTQGGGGTLPRSQPRVAPQPKAPSERPGVPLSLKSLLMFVFGAYFVGPYALSFLASAVSAVSVAVVAALPIIAPALPIAAAVAVGLGVAKTAQVTHRWLNNRADAKAIAKDVPPPPHMSRFKRGATHLGIGALAAGAMYMWGTTPTFNDVQKLPTPEEIAANRTKAVVTEVAQAQKESTSPLASSFLELGTPNAPVRKAFTAVRGQVWPTHTYFEFSAKEGSKLLVTVPASSVAGMANVLMCQQSPQGKAQTLAYAPVGLDVNGDYHIQSANDMKVDPARSCEEQIRAGVGRFYGDEAAHGLRRVAAPRM